ncbi:hypothetical protein [Trabulsiella guamensis]|nr:hypothetical protein [Trabulsiella guamensis]
MSNGIPSACPRARRCTLLRIVTALLAKSDPVGVGRRAPFAFLSSRLFG